MSSPVEVVDISNTKLNQQCAKKLLQAAEKQGFIFIDGSGFTENEVKEAFKFSEFLFNLPLDVKEKYAITPENYGYSRIGQEFLDINDTSNNNNNKPKGDPKEAFNFSKFKLDPTTGKFKINQKLPTELSEKLNIVESFSNKCILLCNKILYLLGLALEIHSEVNTKNYDDNWLLDRHSKVENSGSVLRFLHYPPLNESDLKKSDFHIRAGAHTDYGSLTLLFQRQGDVPCLELLSPVSEKWELVPSLKSNLKSDSKSDTPCSPILINIGDQLSFWTAGLLKSTMHRVRFPNKITNDRYSIAYFCHPNSDTLLSPIPSDVVRARSGGANDQTEDSITAGEHLRRRLDASYKY